MADQLDSAQACPQSPTNLDVSRQISSSAIYQPINVPRRVHILGSGSVGKFIAHAIRGVADPPPVTLLLHQPTLYDEFEKADKTITMFTGKMAEVRTGFDAELSLPQRTGASQSHIVPTDQHRFLSLMGTGTIYNLIVTVKATQVVSALNSVKHRLKPETTICFLQNGMGIIEEVNEAVFPDPEARPSYMLGVNSHGVNSDARFTVNHAGHGIISLSLLPRGESVREEIAKDKSVLWAPTARYLLRTLTRTPLLAAVALSPTDLLQVQLEKLAANCIINTLTVILDARNGDILNNFALSRVRYLLLAEISLVLQSLPELRGIPNVNLRFSPERLDGIVTGVAQKTAQNISSMLQDVRRGVRTEVEYINGYIVKRGEEIGFKAVMNYMITQLVIGKQAMTSKEIDNFAPVVW